MKAIARKNDLFRSIDIILYETDSKTITQFFLEREQVEEGVQPGPSFVLRYEEAQGLMDQLWDCGLRPSEGNAGTATQKHLEDMRRLVFDVLMPPLTGPFHG